MEIETPPAAFSAPKDSKAILSGIKVVEMCIAGPSIRRILTEYGADVIKVTSPKLSDTPFFEIEGNMGKHATDWDLRREEDRKVFEELLADADVVVDGYRTGALSRLCYGPLQVQELAVKRGKGMIYVSENCFGYGTHIDRPGWQQVADAVSGVAWAQGKFIGINERCIPPFPMSDYGTGLIGAMLTLEALFSRAKREGSYHAKCCLVQCDNL
jgi:crotonobetainyl-CoA:carnitine CoA-transferase CaiB-like acyl-CoA transferase